MHQSTFSTSYTSARARFRSVVAAIAGSQLDAVSYPERGPVQEELTTDVAWIGPTDARRILVIASGTHGVEGFCGSGAQIAWLERYTAKQLSLPPATAVMMIHAINPFGFAWRRRVTHENVDLNRNWVDFNTTANRNLEYDDIAAALCPADWSDESRDRTWQQLLQYAGQHTLEKFIQVVSGGQYRHQRGLFYGGASATVARRNLTAILQERLAHAEHVAIIDFHSGLGAYGDGELIAASMPDTDAFRTAQSWFGASIKPIGTQGADFAKIAGDWVTAVPQLLPHATVTAIAVEFGTVPPMHVLEALRADNWLHTHGDRNSPLAEEIRAQMTNAFYVDDDCWRGMIVGQSLLACRQALAGLEKAR